MKPVIVPVPPTRCPPAAATPAPAPAGPPAPALPPGVRKKVVLKTLATPAPGVSENAQQNGIASVIAASLKVAAPANLHSVTSGTDCGTHVGAFGALVCPDMMKSGDLLLIWDWRPGDGPDTIDGYRIYRSTGELLATRPSAEQTLFDVPKPRNGGGYNGTCYAVSAYVGSRESARSPVYCAGGGSVATTVQLRAMHGRVSWRERKDAGFDLMAPFGTDDPVKAGSVGFKYSSEKHLIKDSYDNIFYRSAWAFDLSPLLNRRLFAAKLKFTIATSEGAGNNHSCAAQVGEGVEFWWKNAGWLDGRFGDDIGLGEAGPTITADVTKIVAPWMRGEPNYGFVVKGADENLGAFTNKTCFTTYTPAVLEVTYY